jgi:hypothetical protein
LGLLSATTTIFVRGSRSLKLLSSKPSGCTPQIATVPYILSATSFRASIASSFYQALREWIPLVLHYVDPWSSEADIAAGERSAQSVAKELEPTIRLDADVLEWLRKQKDTKPESTLCCGPIWKQT